VSDYLEDSFERMAEPVGFEVEPGATTGIVGGVHLEPSDSAPFVVALRSPAAGGGVVFNVNQYLHGLLIGGSQFILR
jgi:hypothetical protein